MEKVKFVILVVLLVIGAYVTMLPVWSIVYDSAFATANSVNSTANAYVHRFTIGMLRFSPLILWFVPGLVGVAVIAWKLKFSRKNDD